MQRTQEEMRQELLGRAAADDAFRTRLIEDPKSAIKEAIVAGHTEEDYGWYTAPTEPHTHYEGGPVHGG